MKSRITLSVDDELVRWLDGKVGLRTYANRSHAVELLLRRKIDEDGKA